jgi:hypothetical protein
MRRWKPIPMFTGGSGHFSMVTTHLFEQAREIVLEYLGLSKRKYIVIFRPAVQGCGLGFIKVMQLK